MLERKTRGSVVCPSCGRLVGVNDERCYHCGHWNPGLWGWAPALGKLGNDFGFTPLLVTLCLIFYGISLLMGMRPIEGGGLLAIFGILAPETKGLLVLGASGGYPVIAFGHWWTVLTAGWLHGSLPHILFNLYYLAMIAPGMAKLYGVGRMTIIYVLSSAVGFLTTSVMFLVPLPIIQGAPLTVGASAGLCGFLGALLTYYDRTGNIGMRSRIIQSAIGLLIFGLVLGFVDNWAHIGGFVGGWLAARWLDPLRPETQNHLLGALACLIATVLAFVVQFITPLPEVF
ncbi:MAG: rhomboid family intramembrane serine protease [Acidobacteriota bacterium]